MNAIAPTPTNNRFRSGVYFLLGMMPPFLSPILFFHAEIRHDDVPVPAQEMAGIPLPPEIELFLQGFLDRRDHLPVLRKNVLSGTSRQRHDQNPHRLAAMAQRQTLCAGVQRVMLWAYFTRDRAGQRHLFDICPYRQSALIGLMDPLLNFCLLGEYASDLYSCSVDLIHGA